MFYQLSLLWQVANIVELETLRRLLTTCYRTASYREKTEELEFRVKECNLLFNKVDFLRNDSITMSKKRTTIFVYHFRGVFADSVEEKP